MTASRWILMFATVVFVAGCRGGPILPPDEIPADFVFGYEYTKISDLPDVGSETVPGEMPETVPEEAAEEAGETAGEKAPEEAPEKAPAEDPEKAPAEDPEKAPAGDPEKAPAEDPEEAPADDTGMAPAEEPEVGPKDAADDPVADPEVAPKPEADPDAAPKPVARPVPIPMSAKEPEEPKVRPVSIRLEVRATGDVVYSVEYEAPTPGLNSGVLRIDDQTLQKIYDRVREADLSSLEKRYVGEDFAAGEETYHVVGSDLREVWIDVYATRVHELTRLWKDVMKLLPEGKILVPPAPATKAFLMDRTTAKIHRSACPQVEDLVEAARVELPSAQAGLNLGGFPCEECKPLSK